MKDAEEFDMDLCDAIDNVSWVVFELIDVLAAASADGCKRDQEADSNLLKGIPKRKRYIHILL